MWGVKRFTLRRQSKSRDQARRPTLAVVMVVAALCAGCTPRAPSFLLLGSYFPSWLIGLILGVVLTVLVRLILIRRGLDDVLPLRLLVYTCLTVIFTLVFSFLFSPR